MLKSLSSPFKFIVALILCLSTSNFYSCHCSSTDDLLGPPSKQNIPTFFTLSRFNKYVAYLDMKLPSRLSTFIEATPYRRGILSFQVGIDTPTKVIDGVTKYPIPDTFENQGLHSSFLVNFWQPLVSVGIYIGAVIAFIVLHHITERNDWTFLKNLFGNLKTLFKFNFIFVLLSLDIDDIIYFSSLEFKTIRSGTKYDGLSIFFCILMFCVTWLFLLFSFYQAMTPKNASPDVNTNPNVLAARSEYFEQIRSVQVFHAGFKSSKKSARLFYFIYASRFFISAMLGAYWYTSPIGQSVIQLLLSIVMILTLLLMRPFTRAINTFQVLIIELIHLLSNVGVIVVAGCANTDNLDSSGSIFFADLVIIMNIAANFTVIFFLGVKLIIGISTIWELRKDKNTSIALWVHLLAIIIQQGGFGFEEIFIDEKFLSVNKRTIHEEVNHVFNEEVKLHELRHIKTSSTGIGRNGSTFTPASPMHNGPLVLEDIDQEPVTPIIIHKDMNETEARNTLLHGLTPASATTMKRTDGWRNTLIGNATSPSNIALLNNAQNENNRRSTVKSFQSPKAENPFYYEDHLDKSPLKARISHRMSHRASSFIPR